MKLYYYIDQDGLMPPLGVQYHSDRAITTADILQTINTFYHRPMSQENVQYYIMFDSNYKHRLNHPNPKLLDAMGDFYLQSLLPYQDGYIVNIYD